MDEEVVTKKELSQLLDVIEAIGFSLEAASEVLASELDMQEAADDAKEIIDATKAVIAIYRSRC